MVFHDVLPVPGYMALSAGESSLGLVLATLLFMYRTVKSMLPPNSVKDITGGTLS